MSADDVDIGDVVAGAHVLAALGLVTAYGHVSRRSGTRMVITPAADLAYVTVDGLVEVALDARELPPGAPAEAWAHLALYRARPDVHSVARAQPAPAFAAAATGSSIPVLYGQVAWLGRSVPIHDSAHLLRSPERAHAAAAALPAGEALLLRGNGALTVGDTAGLAVARMWLLSALCEAWLALGAGRADAATLTAAEIASWRAVGPELLPRLWTHLQNQVGVSIPNGQGQNMTDAGESSDAAGIDTVAIAEQLRGAYGGITVDPPTASHPGLSVDDAYTIQQRQVERRRAEGAVICGFKIGLTSAAMQQQLGVDQPDFGHLFADMVRPADAPIACSDYLQPRAEPEIALVLKAPLKGPGLSVADVLRATDFVLPAIEIIDSRVTAWKISLSDTIADNASSGGLVLGTTRTLIDGLNLSMLGCVLRRNGRIEYTGAGAAVMGSPLFAATWLANTLTARGVELAAGHLILTGSITAAIPVRAGDTVTATIDQLGSVTAVFD